MTLSAPLLRWYRKHGRRLPWRNTRNPYRILVSEMMLQQTQVSRVIDFYRRWMETFPDWSALAEASNAEVIEAWSGLGYNRRALALRDIARQVIKRGMPKTREDWQSLRGIGPYTSAAITALSLRQPVLPIDTNIRRVVGRSVLGRLFPTTKHDQIIERRGARVFLQTKHTDDVVQALFDLASSVCMKDPVCRECPLRNQCKSSKRFLSGNVKPPKHTVKKSNERHHRGKRYPDRIYRGRILKQVRMAKGGTPLSGLGTMIDSTFDKVSDQAWLRSMVQRLEREGFVDVKRNRITLTKK